MPKANPPAPPSYRVVAGLNYPGVDGEEKRAEAGDVVSDLPANSVEWLLVCGAIVDANEPVAVDPVAPEEVV